eukprot:gene8476-950_t
MGSQCLECGCCGYVDHLGSYCNDCWQAYIQFGRARASHISDAKKKERNACGLLGEDGTDQRKEDEESELGDELRGVFHDNDELYLVNDEKGIVYFSERDENDALVEAGIIHDGRLIISSPVSKDLWQCDEADHCETPLCAIQDIQDLLLTLASRLGKPPSSLQIYDPYYCAGGIKIHLAKLGFLSVRNEPEDFYKRINTTTLGFDYDIIITNPPYSSIPTDHVMELANFLYKQPKPWLVLQPNYVYTKDEWNQLIRKSSPQPFFITPPAPRSYVYQAPAVLRSDKKKKNLKTSPFVTFWFCNMREHQSAIFEALHRGLLSHREGLNIATKSFYLPDNFKDSKDRTRKKRKKEKKIYGKKGLCSNSATFTLDSARSVPSSQTDNISNLTRGTPGQGEQKDFTLHHCKIHKQNVRVDSSKEHIKREKTQSFKEKLNFAKSFHKKKARTKQPQKKHQISLKQHIIKEKFSTQN